MKQASAPSRWRAPRCSFPLRVTNGSAEVSEDMQTTFRMDNIRRTARADSMLCCEL